MDSESQEAECSQPTRTVPPLAIYRFSKGYSQRALAERAGLTRETVCNIENGHTRPALRTARAIAAALDVDVGELFPEEVVDRPSQMRQR